MYNRRTQIYNIERMIGLIRVRLPGGESVKRQRSLGQYRAIDLALFAVLTTIFEFVATKAGLAMPYAPYLLSVTPVLTAVVMMRWGLWGAIHAALGGIVYCFAAGLEPAGQWYLICGAGNLLGVAALGLLRYLGWEKVREKTLLTLLYGALVHLLMQIGRSALMLILGAGGAQVVNLAMMEAVTLLFTLVLMWIVRRVDGLFEDQRHYLRRVSREEEEGGF